VATPPTAVPKLLVLAIVGKAAIVVASPGTT